MPLKLYLHFPNTFEIKSRLRGCQIFEKVTYKGDISCTILRECLYEKQDGTVFTPALYAYFFNRDGRARYDLIITVIP